MAERQGRRRRARGQGPARPHRRLRDRRGRGRHPPAQRVHRLRRVLRDRAQFRGCPRRPRRRRGRVRLRPARVATSRTRSRSRSSSRSRRSPRSHAVRRVRRALPREIAKPHLPPQPPARPPPRAPLAFVDDVDAARLELDATWDVAAAVMDHVAPAEPDLGVDEFAGVDGDPLEGDRLSVARRPSSRRQRRRRPQRPRRLVAPGRAAAAAAAAAAASRRCAVPVVDLMNHACGAPATLERRRIPARRFESRRDGAVAWVATRRVEKGEDVRWSYGAETSNETLWLWYGLSRTRRRAAAGGFRFPKRRPRRPGRGREGRRRRTPGGARQPPRSRRRLLLEEEASPEDPRVFALVSRRRRRARGRARVVRNG